MKRQELINLVKYLYFTELRLSDYIDELDYRYTRRDFDSVDLLEMIIAKERLKTFYEIEESLIKILHLQGQGSEPDALLEQ